MLFVLTNGNFIGRHDKFSKYMFDEKQSTPENLLDKIKEIFKTDSYLQKDFATVLVVHQNNLFKVNDLLS